MSTPQRRGLLAERKREKESHLQDPFNREKEEEKKQSTTIRASAEAFKVIEDFRFEGRHKSMQAALDEIVRVYLLHKDVN